MTSKTTKTAKRPADLMDIHMALLASKPVTEEAKALTAFADEVVRACAASASEMRRRVFSAVEALKASQGAG